MGKIKVLIVEDDESLLNLYDRALDDERFEKHTAVNGLDAVREYETKLAEVLEEDL